MKRILCSFYSAAILLLAGLGYVQPVQAAGPVPVAVTVDYYSPGTPVSDLVFGTNIEWVDNGDNFWDPDLQDFRPERIAAVAETHPTSIRFPGGVHADTYHWKQAVGPMASRTAGQHYYKTEPVASNFGTDEFLKLCKRLNARPVFTINIISGTPAEAAEWVQYVNTVSAQNNYPAVLFWEIGNEPYLDNKIPRISPDVYVQKYLAFSQAIRQVDPAAPLGALMVGQELEKQYVSKYTKGWNQVLLAQPGAVIDYGVLHNAYYPGFIWNPLTSTANVFNTAFSSVSKIKSDMTWLKTLTGTRPIKFFISEYNSFFGLNTRYDAYVSTLGGTLYMANVLQEFLGNPNITGASYWSMFDNWYFGLVYGTVKRPNYYLFKLYSGLKGKFNIPVSPVAVSDLKLIAFKESGKIWIYAVNNNQTGSYQVKFTLKNFQPLSAGTIDTIYADSMLAGNESGTEKVNIQTAALAVTSPLLVTIKPHSIVLIKLNGQ